MKLDEAKKEKLPVDFLTATVSHSWEEIGNLKASISGIHDNFTDTKKIEDILQDLVDAYLICVGQLELYMDKKDYIDAPEELELKESLNEADDEDEDEKEVEETEIADPPEKVEKINDGENVELHTELPDYDVEVEQKGDKVEVEIEPKENKDIAEFDIEANKIKEPEINSDEAEFEIGEPVVNNTKNDEPFEFFTDFPEAEPNEEADDAVRAWLNR